MNNTKSNHLRQLMNYLGKNDSQIIEATLMVLKQILCLDTLVYQRLKEVIDCKHLLQQLIEILQDEHST